MTGRVGVAISTTGTRDAMLERAISAWYDVGVEYVTVQMDEVRKGVAWNKNRGITTLVDSGCTDLFLADDDMYPLSKFSWTRYVDDPALHLSLCWGRHRREKVQTHPGYTTYTWPRGVLLYLHRSVVETVGGMRTEYGAGGHEHVDLSRRIHQAGLTPAPFMDLDQDPREWFHAEDMPRPGEAVRQFQTRKRRHTTIKRTTRDRQRVDALWAKYDGDTSYVEYR